ncbi:MAG: hypothetical protein NTY48_06620, partial [Candidatus Diapherotrites archaeon]|nr:hypothetical protein [Candidatus Diapherotrites archaeon]
MGIYSWLEKRWYDFLDVVNKAIPIYGLTDKIDSVIPSFLLFLLLVLLLVVVGGYYFLGNGFPQIPWTGGGGGIVEQTVTITVLSNTGGALSEALVEYDQNCNGEIKSNSLITNASGKGSFKACASSVNISVSKSGYDSKSALLILPTDKEKTINLSITEPVPSKRTVSVRIIDAEGTEITQAKLEFVCVKNASSTTRQINSASGSEYQPSGGFEFEINENCDSANLNATAQGYTDKTRVLGNDDVEKTIQLEVAVIKGTVIFTADSPLGPQGGAIITITDHLGRVQTITTTSSGNVERELDEGNYTYSAFLKGYTKTGSFSIEANSTIEKTIYFTELTPANPERFIKLRLKGRDANILVGEARIFYRKSGDVNLFVTATTDSNGLIGPVPIQDTNGRTYFAVIKSTGYKTQIYSSIVLLKEEEQPQIVQLYLGSPVLTVHVIDDVGSGVASTTSLPCVTRVILSGYPEDFFDTVTTDSNGNAIYRGLPDGNYLVTAINDLDDGSNWAYVGASDTEIQITLVTGTGTVRFRFYLGNDVVSSSYKILQKVGDDFNVIKVSTTPSTYADTVQLRSGSQVKIETIGADYFPSESFVYTIKRGAQEKRVILRNSDTIPNANPVQLILRKILTTNPINSVETVSPTQALEAGHTYYFLYDLVLNSIGDGNIIVNAYVSGQTLIGSKGMLLEGAKSIFGTATILTNTKQQFVIDKNVVDHDAIQLNILAQTQTSPKTIPLFFIISIDNNSEQSQQSLYWQARFADKESAAYKKDFNINNVYCFEDCPAILFSPQLKIGTQAWGAITSSINKLIVGDNYRIKLGAENISDNNYGDVNLELKTSSLLINRQALAFKDNLAHEVYSVSKITALSPFSKVTSDLEAVLYPKKASSSAEIPVYRTISQNGANPNPFASLNGGDAAKLRFSVKNRGEVGIEINLAGKINTINEKVNYPFMTVKTFLQPTILGGLITPISAYWEVSDKTGIILSGHKTDSNGIELWTFDASAYKVGDKITFKAWDEESSTPAVLVIEVTNPFDPEPDSPSCLKIQLPDGTDIKSLTNPILNIDYSETGEIDINSTCNTQRTIKVNSDFTPPENSVDVKKGETAHISFDVKEVIDERNGTLGAYPLQVLEKTGSTTWDQIGFLDIVVTDSNVNAAPFELSNAVFDFSNAENVPAYVTNKTLAGRLDVYYPQMEIDKSGLGIVYSKGGVPQLLDLDFNIDTNALEGITYGYLVSQSFGVAVKDFGGTANCKNQLVMAYLATPNTTGQSLQGYLNGTSGLKFNPYYGCSALAGAVDYNFLFDTIGAQIDGNIANRYLNYPSQNRVRTCGDLCDPTKPFYSLPIESQDTILSQIPNARITAAPIGTEETNLDTLHFSIANPTPKPVPLKQVKGDIYETYPQAVNIPLTAVQVGCGDVNTWKLADVDILSIAPLGFSSSKWNVAYRDTNGRLFVCNKYASTDINFVNFTNSSLNEYLDLKRYFGWGGMLLHNSVPSFRMVGGTATTVVGA